MYGIPKNFDLSNLIGKKIENILLDPYVLHFNFSGKWVFQCAGKIELIKGNKEIIIKEKESYYELNFITSLFNSSVSSWRIIDTKSFYIVFDNGMELKFTDDSDIYESFQIYPEGWII